MIAVLLAEPARATEDQTASSQPSATRVGLTLTLGPAILERSPSPLNPTHVNQLGGGAVGIELRIHPVASRHGFLLGATGLAAVFGPGVNIFDLDYSLRLFGPPHLSGVTGAAYVEAGPFLATVGNVAPDPDHSVAGGRVGLAADLQFANFTLGLEVDYRGGVPLGNARSPWEEAFTTLLRLGIVFNTDDSH
jgi:hypothetical protein